uniref:Phosphatidylinositol-specific phospholipase C X domain-containing protein n=1 Tax=Mola mola TaxID=94237 RepID=A0A3Q4BVW0_MOLML
MNLNSFEVAGNKAVKVKYENFRVISFSITCRIEKLSNFSVFGFKTTQTATVTSCCLELPVFLRTSMYCLQQSVLRDQCDLGVRFLDLRIARKPAAGAKLFFAHGIYTLLTVKEALCELAAWLDAHPKEIVIVSCSHFELLSEEDHVQLVDFIIGLFGTKLCSSQDTPTLSSCWSRGQQVVVFYDDQQMNLWIFAAGFYVSGLNLTEDAPYVLLHPLRNMKTVTKRALSLLLGWASEQRPGSQVGGVNILCFDFVDISCFCSLVIGLNYKWPCGVDEWERLHVAQF